ncbi:MAG: hypothetical protein SWE60_22015, partial [Thermodesulfobacteriota bacterium]|nr:hypothetical protein [Thermodesulfobacteriota bacterium]
MKEEDRVRKSDPYFGTRFNPIFYLIDAILQLFPEYYLSSVRKQNQRDSRHGKRGHLRNHLHGFHIPVMG